VYIQEIWFSKFTSNTATHNLEHEYGIVYC